MSDYTAPDAPSVGTRSNSNKRYSLASIETGESSKRSSIAADSGGAPPVEDDEGVKVVVAPERKSTTRRSHKSKSSASFLLGNAVFEPPRTHDSEPLTRLGEPSREHKGKHVQRSPEKKHSKKRVGLGVGVGASRSGGKDSVAANGHRRISRGDTADQTDGASAVAPEALPALDVDSRQIVNLALNLSESRRNAQRRNVSNPLPPTISGFGEGFAGGSLRHHLQQQRRSSRNVSPKPDRGERSFTASPKLPHRQSLSSPLQPAFEEDHNQYQFSASTLARAEKARNSIELMAQYRRLLQYVPPLKPGPLSRAPNSTPPGSRPSSPTSSSFPQSQTTTSDSSQKTLGRNYNPLQYIRNRTVRARERTTIDGEIQGFGNLEDVKYWVDTIARDSDNDNYRAADCVPLPALTVSGPNSQTSPNAAMSRTASKKVQRPRVGWMTNPADMLAEIYWLEQGDNKKSIEDNHWNKIYPRNVKLVHSRKGDEPQIRESIEPKDEHSQSPELHIDTKLPNFKPMRYDSDSQVDSGSSRIRQKLHNLGHFRDHSRDGRTHRRIPKISRSRSESSDSGSDRRATRRGRSNTTESQNIDTNVLEKQMLEMLAKEARDIGSDASNGPLDTSTRKMMATIESAKSKLRGEPDLRRASVVRATTDSPKPDSAKHRRNGSILRSDESRQTSGRSSLEVPDSRRRRSMDVGGSIPASPQLKAKPLPSLVPALGMSLTPSQSRTSSPTRLEKIRSKIPFGRSDSPDRSVVEDSAGPVEIAESSGDPLTPDRLRRRSTSPQKKIFPRKTEDSLKSTKSILPQRKESEPSGIKGLFKSGRNHVSKIGELIWKKDASPASVVYSTDVSDDENSSEKPNFSRSTTLDPSGELSPQKERKSFDLPTFTSPFERRGRDKRVKSDEFGSPESHMTARQRHDSLRTNRFDLLKPPRIDIHDASPASSPDMEPIRRLSTVSDVSDLDRTTSNARNESARLNSILGIPGHLHQFPATALSSLEPRRPSVSKRQWSISDGRSPSTHRTPTTRRELARTRALLLSSGVKAQEILRRAAEVRDMRLPDPDPSIGRRKEFFSEIAAMNRDEQLILKPIPRSQEHIMAARILSNDTQLSSRMWQDAAESFSSSSIGTLLDRVEDLQNRIVGKDGLSDMSKKAADMADNVSKELVETHTSSVRVLSEKMERLMRRRRQRFRWVRKGGWVILEWVLVGVMWWVWALVVLARTLRGLVRGVGGVGRWLLWL